MWSFLDKRFEDILGSIMLAVMVTITFLNVIVRYCTNFSFAWTEEVTINFFVWVVLLGTARTFREGSNLCMNLLYDACPRTTRLFLYIVCVILCVLFFSALCWTGTLEVFDEIELESTSESLEIPVWLYTMCTPLLSLLVIFRILQRATHSLRTGKY